MLSALKTRTGRVSRDDNSGFVLVFMALFLAVLLGIAGFSVDLGFLYLKTARMQRAVDAAALAGAVFLPSHPTQATAQVKKFLAANGFPTDDAHLVVGFGAQRTGMIQVTLKQQVPTFFAQMVGFNQFNPSTTATAEFHPPAPMGSPSNLLGSEPEQAQYGAFPQNCPSADCWERTSSRGLQNAYWVSMSGGKILKSYGDEWTANGCADQQNPTGNSGGADDCPYESALAVGGASPTNTDYSKGPTLTGTGDKAIDNKPEGQQTFIVRVDPTVSNSVQQLNIQLFDPEFANTGDLCDRNTMNFADRLAGNNPSNRYYKYNYNPSSVVSPYCAGDQRQAGAESSSGADGTVPMDTTFMLTAPGSTTATPAACQHTYLGHEFLTGDDSLHDNMMGDAAVDNSGNPILDGNGNPVYVGAVTQLLQDPTGAWDNDSANGRNRFYNSDTLTPVDHTNDGKDPDFAQNFHQWVDFCTISVGGSAPTGDYQLHVLTPTDAAGTNRFSIRATVTNNPIDPGVSVFGQQQLVVYSNSLVNTSTYTATSSFFLAQVPSTAAGSDLNVVFFDIGDAAAANDGNYINLSIVPPTDAHLTLNAKKKILGPFSFPKGSCTATDASDVSGGNASFVNRQLDEETSVSTGRPNVPLNGGKAANGSPNCTIEKASGDGQANPTAGQYFGKKIYVKVHIPSNYSCQDVLSFPNSVPHQPDVPNPNGCWFRLELDYHDVVDGHNAANGNPTTDDTAIFDTSSWQANVGTQPLHLSKDSDFG